MQNIVAPIQPGDSGAAVANLQSALLFLIDRGIFRVFEPPNSPTAEEIKKLLRVMRSESQQDFYGDGTRLLINFFQIQQGLGDDLRGGVEEKTADRLNELLKELGAFSTSLTLAGTVINRQNGLPLVNGNVEAFFSINNQILLNRTATTGANGEFVMQFDRTLFADLPDGQGIDVFFQVSQNNQLLPTDTVLRGWQPEDTRVEILVTVASPEPVGDAFVVKGTVRQANGELYPEAIVRAFDKDLRREQFLGESLTNQKGNYEITYRLDRFQEGEQGGADLIVRVLNQAGELQTASPIVFNAKPVEIIDLTGGGETREQSEYERMIALLRPLLQGQAIADLRQDDTDNPELGQFQDISFLSGETRLSPQSLTRLILAHRLARQAIQPEFWFALLGSSFNQEPETRSLDDQFAAVLTSLPNLNATAVDKALTRSFDQNEIPAFLNDLRSSWLEAFLQFAAQQLIGEAQSGFVRSVLVDAGVDDREKQEKFARLYNQFNSNQGRTLTPGLVETLQQDSAFTQPEIDTLQTSFRLADLTQGDFSVVKAIKDEFEVGQPDQVRTLAKRSQQDWITLVQTKYDRGEINLPFEVSSIAEREQLPEAEIYGKMLDRQFRDAFPTTAFTGGLERALQNGGTTGIQRPEVLTRFLDRHTDFELLNTPVDEFWRENLQPEFQDLANDDAFRLEVKAVQRVFKLAPNFEATDALLGDNLHSAQKIYRLGESEFVRQYGDRPGFTPETAQIAWNRAADTHAAVLTLVADLKSLETEGLPLALQNDPTERSTPGNTRNLSRLRARRSAVTSFPNWNNLFRSGDLCECESCRSVLSPAAYFADLLMFLKDRKKADGTYSVKEVLFDRRPDLGFLELNCDNALVPLPYVDVVCEVLEAAIDSTGANDLELTGLTTIPTDPTAARTAVTAAFQTALGQTVNDGKQKIALGSNLSLSQIAGSDRWVAHTDTVTYLLKKKPPASNYFATLLPNTKGSAAELRAYPQYVNPKAYDKLRQAKYPMTLPFDLFAEEVRAGFEKVNLHRWALMQTLRGTAAPNNPSIGDIAAVYFGISISAVATEPSEKSLILVADTTTAGQQAIWGEQGNADWLKPNPTTETDIKNAVGNVKKLLRKTNLEYNDLLALLDLSYINPDGSIAIQHSDSSCDTDKKAVLVLNATILDRIHRFLRLWRKLDGWKLWELDLVLRHSQIGNGTLDETFLINLFYFCQVRAKLGSSTTVEQVCALFGNLNTATRFTKLHEKRDDALYQNLFLNKRLIQPIVPAFAVANVTVAAPTTAKISSYHPVLLAALGVRESDLVQFKGLTSASAAPYITDDLTLTNLSFLWRQSWLARRLKIKAEDWRTVLNLVPQAPSTFANLAAKQTFLETYHIRAASLTEAQADALLQQLFYQNIFAFACPKSAFEFLEKIDHLRATGFSIDEFDWLLGNSAAKAAPKETDAIRFLTALRQQIQSIQAEFDPAQFDFLTATPPTDENSLTALLTTLLQKLNRSETEIIAFLSVLQGTLPLEIAVELPGTFAFPAAIVGAPQNIPIRFEQVLRFTGTMTAAQKNILLTDASLSAVFSIPSYQNAIEALSQQSGSVSVAGLPTGFTFPSTITGAPNQIPIRYEQTLRFTGVMTDAQKTALLNNSSLSAVTSLPSYQKAIDRFFNIPRLAVKFFEPVFTAPLASLPPEIDFKTQLPADFALKIAYDAEQELLRYSGILSETETAALLALSPTNSSYTTAVNLLASQPLAIAAPNDRLWLTDSDLDISLLANNTAAKRLATAARKALQYLSRTSTENAIVQQSSIPLGLTEALCRNLFTQYAIVPNSLNPAKTLLFHLADNFAIDAVTISSWFWAMRVAAIWKKWRMTLAALKKLRAITSGAQLLDFASLPLNRTGATTVSDRFLRLSRLIKLRDSLPETQITLLEVLVKLNAGSYPAANFAADVERLNEDWQTADVLTLTNSLNLTYPTAYLRAETWERLQQVFYFLDSLNATADTVKPFAAAAMTVTQAESLKALLRSKFGTETWLTLSGEIQDALRDRKRAALAAYLLSQPQPADAPSGKWENTNDLYAYYLLDVEMSSCQLTSRLVQASGSVQLFVQRCFMGLEPEVVVEADGAAGDSAWRWWKWMRKYRVWEANRKVFLYPENWIEPELKKDRSSFFRELENELLQNEINPETVEKAFVNYLEKLDGVAQLEIAGFYQEDDGDNAIVHVFGRTQGTEPHLYYYRRYDYRQWTPWEKVDLEIQGDYLIPAVVNKRLYLFWPLFTEVPDEPGNATMKTPALQSTEGSFTPTKTQKKLQLQMAVSDYRQGRWTPRRISKDFDESAVYDVEIVKKHYVFYPVDRSPIEDRFGIAYDGYSVNREGNSVASLSGAFEISGCKGVPERSNLPGNFLPVLRPERSATGDTPAFLKWVELESHDRSPQNDFALENLFSAPSNTIAAVGQAGLPILQQTPGLYQMTAAWHLSYLDRLLLDGLAAFGLDRQNRTPIPLGSWLPFFYSDRRRSFFVLSTLNVSTPQTTTTGSGSSVRLYYPQIKRNFRDIEATIATQIQTWIDSLTLPAQGTPDRQQWEQILRQAFPQDVSPPYSNDQLRALTKRWLMRYFHYYLGALSLILFQSRQFHFKNNYHPFVCDFAKLIYNPLKGIPALMQRETQMQQSDFSFRQTYQPTPSVIQPSTDTFYPQEIVDFSPDGSYASYNWELFFHAPLLIANSLSKNQRFEEARDWYHFIFNPIGVESTTPGGSLTSKYWITKPFYETTDPQYVQQRIDSILRMLAGDTTATGYSAQLKKELEDQVFDWRTNPFEPYRIANYRTVAYQKTVVMKYLDNLISWGDNLFRQDSMESINEATQLYILAAEILGPRPRNVPPRAKPSIESFNELETQFDQFSNALVQVENYVPVLSGSGSTGSGAAPLPMLYFCLPQNDKMLGYWDTIADRLYKIRNCMNIEGVVRQLALFEPPIDPGALVKAIAAGVDIGSALADLNAPLPLYRFNVLLQKANEVCNDVKALGSALLIALEKKDAEAMALLRQAQEIRLLEAIKALREQQIQEAKENLEGLKQSKITVQTKRNYYRNIPRIIAQEQLQLTKLEESHVRQELSQAAKLGASVISILPAIDLGASGFGGSPIAKFKLGGLELGQAANLAADVLSVLGQIAANDAAMASIKAGFDRRWEDWKLQERLADQELLQLERQILAAEVRVAIADRELENQIIQIENAKETDQFMREKYTNQELYQWQIGQISGVYFQSYRLAYDLAKRAERCFRFELGLQDSSYIQFGYWDSLKKGLHAGEKLQYDLRRLEAAYLDQNRREFELTKHISLALLAPLALVKLRETGRCFINLPEEIFDLDYPGHYFRRIKSVSLTLPCVTGPYTTISCTLRLLKNSIRINTQNGDNGYPRNTDDQGLPADDSRFSENNIPVKAIAASSAQNDSGVFELSFRDERYLPFEGAGAISQWSLELFNDNSPDFGKTLRQFDYSTITDAILHVKYTARENAGSFKAGAIAHLRNYFSQDESTPALRLLNLRQEFPSQWQRFLNPTNPANGNVFELEMTANLFPIRDRGKMLKVSTIWLLCRCSDAGNYTVNLTQPDGTRSMTLVRVSQYGELHFNQAEGLDAAVQPDAEPPAKWQFTMTRPGGGNLQNSEVEDFLLVLGYQWE